MPPDNPPYLTNEEMLDIVKNAFVLPKYEDRVKEMKQTKEDMQNYMPPTLTTKKEYTNTWDKQFSEQRAFSDMEDRLTKRMQMEIRKVEELHDVSMELLRRSMAADREAMEELVTALVAQNRELSRRVTELEWEGITP